MLTGHIDFMVIANHYKSLQCHQFLLIIMSVTLVA
jgi:hypothetical protein